MDRPVYDSQGRLAVVCDRIQLLACDQAWTQLRPGLFGTIRFIDWLGTVYVEWADGVRSALPAGHGRWQVQPAE